MLVCAMGKSPCLPFSSLPFSFSLSNLGQPKSTDIVLVCSLHSKNGPSLGCSLLSDTLLQQCPCFKTSWFHRVVEEWRELQNPQPFFSLVAIYCRVLLLLTGAAGGALGPSKHKLHLLNSSQVRIVPSFTSWLF